MHFKILFINKYIPNIEYNNAFKFNLIYWTHFVIFALISSEHPEKTKKYTRTKTEKIKGNLGMRISGITRPNTIKWFYKTVNPKDFFLWCSYGKIYGHPLLWKQKYFSIFPQSWRHWKNRLESLKISCILQIRKGLTSYQWLFISQSFE